ncbi:MULTISPECIES: hypothetical protein [unclassified Duganella]|uniref:hypothetical protein n=1 Tax=unclassified Duganella TaxID=2636909 RepID=UPI000E3563B5|nr:MULTISPECIES: hypothetical protein [unclassified Duganella]RFP08239.1 hypothetical protein D0T23_30045 [Duganella sp. BJB475]RFP22439.1 hypothetical protein D0T21_30730 [Duganella sp. BJB476]
MNGKHQPLQEHHSIAERVARLETAIHYQGQAISRLQEGMRADFVRTDGGFVRVDMGFARMNAEFARVHEQLLKIRTTDFRILLSICLTTALGTMSLIVKIYGLL